MNFASDNTTGIHPRILAAIAAAAGGRAMPYGADDITKRVERRFAEVFERECAVFMVGTGAAANALALSVFVPPWGAIYCHPGGHINADECGAPEFYTAGAKLVAIPGAAGKVAAADIDRAYRNSGAGTVHVTQPAAVSLTQLTEAGTIYRPDELGAIGDVCRRHGLAFHIDGARFGNAVVGSGHSPADLTWRAGVDVLSFGATKNGAMAAEAVVFFDPAKAATMGWRRKRAAQLWSKHRFLAAQMDAYLADGLWLACARHANAMAARLADGLAAIPGSSFRDRVEANEIFVRLPTVVLDGLERDGARFYRWPGEDRELIRLVAGYDTAPCDVDAFLASARRHAGLAA
jgi:threonine aldolase